MVNNGGLDLELSTMQDIAMALDNLDPPARARVLHWIQERFRTDATPSVPPASAPATVTMLRMVPPPSSVEDEQLSVDTLDELFVPRAARPALVESAAPDAPQPITGMLQEFVAEFQEIAREWDGACETPADARRAARILSAVS